MEFMPRLLEDLSIQVKIPQNEIARLKPWLVIYPNGGKVWDPITRTWGEGSRTRGVTVDSRIWAEQLWKQVDIALEDGIWGGVVVGGCCKAGPDEIMRLASYLNS